MKKHLDEQLVRKWIDALRSGDYPQTKYRMRNFQGFCCLGVLCDIADVNWNTIPSTSPTKNSYPPPYLMEKVAIDQKIKTSPLAKHMEEALNGSRFTFRHLDNNTQGIVANFLTTLNDELGWSFHQIADWIEQHILPLAINNEKPET